METNSLNIKHFGDYRTFLTSYFEQKKKTNPNFSLGMWSRRLGLSTTTSLSRILTGERAPADDTISKLAEYFGFSPAEKSYFEDLVRLNKIKDDIRLKVILMEKMGREHPDANLMVIDDLSHEVIGQWFCIAIWEMTRLADFDPDPAWIKQRLLYPVSEKEIKWALDLLLSQGLIKKDGEGKIVASKGLLHTTNDVASKAIKSYHQQTLKLASEALYKTPLEMREITAESVTVSVEKMPEAKELIRAFKKKFVRMMGEQSGNQTYQIQIQLFPLTKEVTYGKTV